MAEVTGFTSARMLVIENETVVDGEVQGDNLILMTRQGTPIDAGSVRGPQGTPGTNGTNGTNGAQGPPGPVPSVNDQVGAVYTPRVFANKAALDLWTPADGAHGWTSADRVLWVRISGAWTWAGPRGVYSMYTRTASGGWGGQTEYAIGSGICNVPFANRVVTCKFNSYWYLGTTTGASWIGFRVRQGSGTTGTVLSTNYLYFPAGSIGNSTVQFESFKLFSQAAGQILTPTIQFSNGFSQADLQSSCQVLMEDHGPHAGVTVVGP
jgi:hypothetical protein